MPRVFWNPYFQKGAGLARHAEPQAGNFQPIELMKSVSGGQTLCRQPCARTLCRQPCAGEPCAGLPCANPAGRGTRWHKVGLFRGQPYIYIYIYPPPRFSAGRDQFPAFFPQGTRPQDTGTRTQDQGGIIGHPPAFLKFPKFIKLCPSPFFCQIFAPT